MANCATQLTFVKAAGLKDRAIGTISRFDSALARAGPVGNGALWNCKRWEDVVGVANVEEHSLGNLSGHCSGFEIQDEKSLPAFNFEGVFAFLADAGENCAVVISEIHGEFHEFLGAWKVFDSLNGAHANVERVESC